MIFLVILAFYWVLCSTVMIMVDMKDGELEEETALGNAFYYIVMVPIIITMEIIIEILGFLRRRMQ